MDSMERAEVDRLFAKLDRMEAAIIAQAESNGRNSAEHEQITKTLERIETQAIKTNGRVTALEHKWIKAIGALVGVSGVFSFIFKVFL